MSLTSIATLLHLVSPSASPSTQTEQCTQAVPGSSLVRTVSCPTHNFLVPNGTFFFELICFVAILFIIWKKALPPIVKALETRQATIKKQFDEAEATRARLEKAEQDYTEALAETRRESSRLREQAQAERAEIVEEARSEAQARVDEMLAQAAERIATERQQTILSLRNEIGELATTLAERVVHDSLREDARQRKLVADFIAGVGASETATAGDSA